MAATVQKIRESLDLNTIFNTTTQEIRRLLEVDRVAIYRFWKDESGECVAESVADGWDPVGELVPVIVDDYLQNYQNRRASLNELKTRLEQEKEHKILRYFSKKYDEPVKEFLEKNGLEPGITDRLVPSKLRKEVIK